MRKPTGTRINTHMPLVGYEVGELRHRHRLSVPAWVISLLLIGAAIVIIMAR